MRTVCYPGLLWLLCLPAMAQEPIVAQGRLLETDSGATGELSIRAPNDRVYWYMYDSKTYVEQDQKLTSVPKLRKGDQIEIVSDTGPDTALRYARIIHVVQTPKEPMVEQHRFTAGRYAMPRRHVEREPDDPLELDFLMPRGTLTFSGVVAQVNDERFVLHTRGGGEKSFYTRADTRYMQDGSLVKGSALRINTRVFVRGSRNLDGEIEAYQVIWGSILEPGAGRE